MTERPPRPLRRTRALPAAAAGVAGEEVGCGRGGARLPRYRSGDRRQRAERRPLPAVAAGAAAAARRSPLLPPAAAATTAPDSELPARCDLRVRSLSRGGGARRTGARPRARAGDRRGARRLADVLASLWLAGAPADQSARRRRRDVRGPAGGRDAGSLELHRGSRRAGARGAAERRVHGVQRPLGVRRARAGRRCPTTDGARSSGRSRRTRTSRGSPPPGGASRSNCLRPRS